MPRSTILGWGNGKWGGGSVWGPYTRFPEREGTRKLNFFVGSAREERRTFLHDFVPWSGDLLGGTRLTETESGESDFFSRFVKRNRWSLGSHEERHNCCAHSRTEQQDDKHRLADNFMYIQSECMRCYIKIVYVHSAHRIDVH